MQHENGAPRRLGLVHTIANIDCDARHDARLCSGPVPRYGPVHMPAKQSGHLLVMLHDGPQRRCFFRVAVTADVMITDVERRMVNKE